MVMNLAMFATIVWLIGLTVWGAWMTVQISSNTNSVQSVDVAATTDINIQNPPSQIDGVNFNPDLSVLLTAQNNTSANGVYKGNPLVLQFQPAQTTYFFISQGTEYANTTFIYNSQNRTYSQISSGDSDGNTEIDGDLTVTGTLSAGTLVTPTLNSNMNTGSFHISSGEIPTQNVHLTNKFYVDNYAQGMIWIASVVTVSESNLTATYTPGGDSQYPGVGATLTGTGGLGTICGYSAWNDGVDRLLVASQTDLKQNGIYLVTTSAGNWVLTRATDNDGNPAYETKIGTGVYVSAGDCVNNRYVIATNQTDLTAPPNVTIGTDDMVWVQISGIPEGVVAPIVYQIDEKVLTTVPSVLSYNPTWENSQYITLSSNTFTVQSSGRYKISMYMNANADGTGSTRAVLGTLSINGGSADIICLQQIANTASGQDYVTFVGVDYKTLTASDTLVFSSYYNSGSGVITLADNGLGRSYIEIYPYHYA